MGAFGETPWQRSNPRWRPLKARNDGTDLTHQHPRKEEWNKHKTQARISTSKARTSHHLSGPDQSRLASQDDAGGDGAEWKNDSAAGRILFRVSSPRPDTLENELLGVGSVISSPYWTISLHKVDLSILKKRWVMAGQRGIKLREAKEKNAAVWETRDV